MSNDEIAATIARLSADNRRMKALLILALLSFAVILLMGQAQQNSTLVGTQFVLQDANGNQRARLFMSELGPVFAMSDGSGHQRLALTVKEGQPTLAFFSTTKELRMNLQGSDDSARLDTLSNSGARCFVGTAGGHAAVGASGDDGKSSAVIRVEERTPALRLLDQSENVRAELASAPAGPMLRLLDPGEQPLVSLVSAAIGPAVLLRGRTGKSRALLSIDEPAGQPSLHMNNDSGKVVVSLP